MHLFDRAHLIGGLVERERRLELRVRAIGRRHLRALGRRALRVETQELVRHLLDVLADLRLRLAEGLPAEAIDLGLDALAARELLDLVQARDRQEELVAARVLDDEHLDVGRGDAAQLLPLRQPERLLLEPEVLADAVVAVDDVVARL